MTFERMTIFNCDGCGVRESSRDSTWQPAGWVGVIVTGPPLRDTADCRRWHLCKTCKGKLAEVLGRAYFTAEELGRAAAGGGL